MDTSKPSQEERDAEKALLNKVISILSLGCSRETAARYLGFSPDVLKDDANRPLCVNNDLQQAEARAELMHMRCIHAAVQEAKNWRASVWWLERMRPELYAKPERSSLANPDLRTWSNRLIDIIAQEVTDDATRRRLLEKLRAA